MVSLETNAIRNGKIYIYKQIIVYLNNFEQEVTYVNKNIFYYVILNMYIINI